MSSTSIASPTYITSTPIPPHPVKESSRTAKWGRMLEPRLRDRGGNIMTWAIKPAKERKLRERVYKGIPDVWRRAAWAILAQRYSQASDRDLENWKQEYAETIDKPSSYDIQIDLDVPRTITGHVMFRTRYGLGQRSLFHTLHCFSLRCTECGYVQGMGPIAATFLNYYEPETVYTTLVQLHDAYNLHAIFTPGFPGLLEQIYVQERITNTMLPGVYEAFEKHTVGTTSYATKWYITLFSNTMPFQTQLRLWDVFLLEGPDVFVMVAIAIVWVFRDHITSTSASFESVLSLLSASFIPEDEDAFLKWIEHALSDKKMRENMVRWREEWKGLVARGEDRDVLL